MKRSIQILSFSIIALAAFFSCDFAEKNIDPNNSTTIEPGPLLTYTQLYTSDDGLAKRTQVGYCMMMVQQTASLDRDEMAGDKYLKKSSLGYFFTRSYNTVIKNMQELIYQTADKDEWTNTYAVALIWKSFLFHRITDLYGDVPYSEAGDGYRTNIYYPKYDRQQAIYTQLVQDIETGLALLDPTKPPITDGDIIYHGDIEKWKRFGNSLLLRLGMRMEHADPALAKSTVVKAVQNGLMQDPEDICLVQHAAGKPATENPLSIIFKKDNLVYTGAVKISKTFIDQLQKTNDPRIRVYCALPDGNTDPVVQKGLPNGYDIITIYQGDTTYNNLTDYSTFNPATLLPLDAPDIFMTHAESELLLAEAILKGWVPGDAKPHYENAVRSSMKQQAVYGENGVINDDRINNYLAQDLFGQANTLTEQLNVLGTEFWIATFLNGYESYANWRRCGYPKLTPVSYSTSTSKGEIPRRLTYPTEEYSINLEHVNDAVANQGADEFSTRIWWDKVPLKN